MYINIPDGFELVTLTRNDLNYLREVTKSLEGMLADNGITVKANDMIVTFYIETWFFDDEPSPTTPPASDWTTDELKENHAGDLYYSGKGYAYLLLARLLSQLPRAGQAVRL